MLARLSLKEKSAALIASCSLAIAALLLCLRFDPAPRYSDFIVGHLAWNAGSKFADLIAGPVFILTLLAALWLFSTSLLRVQRHQGEAASEEHAGQLLWWCVPVLAVLGGTLARLPFDKIGFVLFNVGLAYLGLAALLCRRDERFDGRLFGLSLLNIVLLALLPLAALLAVGRLAPQTAPEPFLRAAAVMVGATMAGSLLMLALKPRALARLLPLSLLLGQFGAALLFLALYPAKLIEPGGAMSAYPTTPALKLLVAALVLWGAIDSLRRYLAFRRAGEPDWASLLSPPALFGVLVALKAGATLGPLILPDDYHFGERLLGWWSYVNGAVPYVDYLPAHGLIGDDFATFLSRLFFDGTASMAAESNRLTHLLLGLAAYLSLRRYSGSIGLAFCAVLLLNESLSWLYLVPFFCLWLSPRLLERPGLWLGVWLISAPIAVLGVPPQGILAVAASGLPALYAAWNFLQQGRWRQEGRPVLAALVVLLLAAALTPAVPMLWGAIRYVLENGPINQVAYGIPWQLSWNYGERSGFVFELVRMSWTIVPVLCAVAIYQRRQLPEIGRARLLPALTVLAFCLLMIPYSMGRIDPGGGSRPSIVGILAWSSLLPIALWWLLPAAQRTVLAVAVAGLAASQNLSLPSWQFFAATFSPTVNVSPLRDGAAAGLANIGRGQVDEQHWDRLTRLQKTLAEKLAPHESYLDLSSRNAQYFYLDRWPRQLAVTAPYNLVPLGQQIRTVDKLSKDLPRIAVLESDNILHDGGGLALRSHYLYRFAVDRYLPSLENGLVLGYANNGKAPPPPTTVAVQIKARTDADWEAGVHRRETAVALADKKWLKAVPPDAEVWLVNGEVRRIVRHDFENAIVWLDGPPLTAALGHPHRLEVRLAPQQIAPYRQALLDLVFAQPELSRIPVAWGRSDASLAKRMTLVRPLDDLPPRLFQLAQDNGGYRPEGNDPQLNYDLRPLNLSGRQAGLLRFEFECRAPKAGVEPRFQLFWWGDQLSGASEKATLRFTGADGVLIVPLDAMPGWLTMQRLQGLRLDLDNADACGAFVIKNAALHQRTAVPR